MSLSSRYSSPLYQPWDSNFRSLFRMMDDIAQNYENIVPQQISSTSIRAFSPKFDVEETEDSYNLHGDLPGIDQKDISIEFTDAHTLVVKGGSSSASERWGPDPQQHGKVTDESAATTSHKTTVEDENAAAEAGKKETQLTTTDPDKKAVGKPASNNRWWISERSSGEFYRSFAFPGRVDQNGVKASLKQGVLRIVVPKVAPGKGTRKIDILGED